MFDSIKRLVKGQPEMTRPTFLVVGLGNPGREYRDTRHNVGFMVIDQLTQSLGTPLSRMQAKALIGQTEIGGQRVILAKPQTFMNLSGQAVASLVKFYKLPLTNLLVIHDEIDLPLGTIRIRPSGGSAGQKGLASTIERLGTQEFPRLRIGIGRPSGRMDAAAYVLQNFSKGEQTVLNQVLDQAQDAVRAFIERGGEYAMNHYNKSLDQG
jgi:peptidyl-tRNA hydrolase, PTH1 family